MPIHILSFFPFMFYFDNDQADEINKNCEAYSIKH